MAIVLTEKPESRQWTTGENASVDLIYTLTGTSNDLTAKAYVEANTDITYDIGGGVSYPRLSITLDPEWVDEVNDTGQWFVTVRYGLLLGGGSLFSFDTTGGTQHISQSLQTITKVAASGTPPDNHGAIGVTKDRIEGVDIPVPVYRFSETHELLTSFVTQAYKGIILNLTGRTNNASYRGMAEGEVLFLGAVGSQQSGENWDITFHFAGSANVTNLSIGPNITVPKWGWEYVWVRYETVIDEGYMTQRPIHAYVERVYEAGDFDGLGIGTA